MKKVLILIITIIVVSCGQTNTENKTSRSVNSDLKKNQNQDNKVESNENSKIECEIGFLDESFKSTYYPFNFENFNSQKILSHFDKSVTIDSIEKLGYDDYKYRIYRFKDSSSYIEFMVKSYEPNAKWFYIEKGEIQSNLFNSKNGVSIGMSRADFAKVLGIKDFYCDTFKISDGELATNYSFYFVDNNLKRIEIYSEN